MNTTKLSPDHSSPRLHPFLRAALGALIMGIGLGIAVAASELLSVALGLAEGTQQFLQALLCSALIVPAIIFMRRRIDRQPLRGLGLPGLQRSVYTFGLGMGTMVGSAVLVFGIATAIGWIEWHSVAWSTLSTFLLTTLVIASLYEAFPEELALRGYAYRNLNTRVSRWLAAVLMTVLFVFVPPVAFATQTALLALFGGDAPPLSLVPAGEDPVTYYTFLMALSAILIFARVITGSLWTAISFHLTMLIINRIALAATPTHTGVALEFTEPVAMLLIPAYLTCATIALSLIVEAQGATVAWRAVTAENSAPASNPSPVDEAKPRVPS